MALLTKGCGHLPQCAPVHAFSARHLGTLHFSSHRTISSTRSHRSIKAMMISSRSRVAIVGVSNNLTKHLSQEVALYTPYVSTIFLATDHLTGEIILSGQEYLLCTIEEKDIVVVCAFMGFYPLCKGFESDAKLVGEVARAYSKTRQRGTFVIFSPNVNRLVAFVAEFLKANDAYMPGRLIGITNHGSRVAQTLVNEELGQPASSFSFAARVPILGGEGGLTTLPIFGPSMRELIKSDSIRKIIELVRERTFKFFNDQQQKSEIASEGMATSSIYGDLIYGALLLITTLIISKDEAVCRSGFCFKSSGMVECDFKGLQYVSTELALNDGVAKPILPDLGDMTKFESSALEDMVPLLKDDIRIGQAYAMKFLSTSN